MVVVTTGATSVGAHERPCQLQSQNGQQVALTFVEVEPMSTESVTTEAASIPAHFPCESTLFRKGLARSGRIEKKKTRRLLLLLSRNASDATQRRHRLRSIARSNASASCTLRH